MESNTLFSIELKVLVGVITFLILSILLWLTLKRKIKLIPRLIIAALLTFCLYSGANFYLDYILNKRVHFDQMSFDQQIWLKNDHRQITMVDDLIDSEIILQKSQSEIIEILGQPTHVYQDSLLFLDYDLGQAFVGIGLNGFLLRIEMKDGLSQKARKISQPIKW